MFSELIWSDERLTLPEILATYPLPQLVKYSDTLSQSNPGGPNQWSDTLLVCRHIRLRKVIGQVVETGDDCSANVEKACNPVLVIPETYKGWFCDIKELTSTKDQHPLLQNSLGKIVAFMPYRFFTMTRLKCFRKRKSDEVLRAVYEKSSVDPNTLVYVDSVHEDYIKYVSNKFVIKEKMKRLLKCCSIGDEYFLVPVDQIGKFYIVHTSPVTARHGQGLFASLYNIKDLLNNPLCHGDLIRPIYGKLPSPLNKIVFPILKLEGIMDVDTVVVCTINEKHQIMEVPVSCNKAFCRCLNWGEFSGNELIRKAISIVTNLGDDYVDEIKTKQVYNFN